MSSKSNEIYTEKGTKNKITERPHFRRVDLKKTNGISFLTEVSFWNSGEYQTFPIQMSRLVGPIRMAKAWKRFFSQIGARDIRQMVKFFVHYDYFFYFTQRSNKLRDTYEN